MSSKSKYQKIPILSLSVAIIVIAICVGLLEATNTTHFFHKSPVVRGPSQPITKVTVNSPSSTSKKPSNSTSYNTGNATDLKGTTDSGYSKDTSKWSTSESGVIVLKNPLANAVISDGVWVYGSSKTAQVNYRLIDNQVGVLAQGVLSVVSGDFSGKLSFQSKGSDGRLDLYTTTDSGREINEVQIGVRFQ